MNKKLNLAVIAGLTAMTLSACNSSNNGTSTPNPSTPNFSAVTASAGNGGGEMLIDVDNNLTWINDTVLDANRDGCISPGNVGPTEPATANSRCENQTYGGFNDWRAPTTVELQTLITTAVASNTTMKYLNPICPALVATDGIVRTENSNPAAASNFPNAKAGDLLGTSLSALNGVPAGVRCVRDGVDEAPTQTRFMFMRASEAERSGRVLVDTKTNLEWINQTGLDSAGDGCVSPSNVGSTEPSEANGRCDLQNFAGHNDWRAPTGSELAEVIKATSTTNGVALKYLVAACPANVSTQNIIRTENANSAVQSAFPNASTGDILANSVADMRGIPSGVRCVRNRTMMMP